jgi:hypothetical protein
MHADLQLAFFAALQTPRSEARARALTFSWPEATAAFVRYLVPARNGVSMPPVDASSKAVTNLT